MNWREIADRLAITLRSRPCNCEGKWGYVDGRPGQWIETKVCSAHLALREYEAAVLAEAEFVEAG